MTHRNKKFLLTNHKDPHVPHTKELLEQRGKGQPHLQSLDLLKFVTILFSPLCQPPVVTLALISCQHCTMVYCTVHNTLGHVTLPGWCRFLQALMMYRTHTCEA